MNRQEEKRQRIEIGDELSRLRNICDNHCRKNIKDPYKNKACEYCFILELYIRQGEKLDAITKQRRRKA